MDKIALPLNIKDVESGKLTEALPEFYNLKNYIENSRDRWHQQESVFDHTLSVMDALKKILSEYPALEKKFNQKIGKNTRRTLLEVATMFHDIGKKETMVKDEDFTKCTGHENVGVEKSKNILKRFDLSKKEIQLIIDIIADHSVFHYLLMPGNQNFSKELQNLRNKFGGSIYLELIVLSYADTVNSKLKIVRPEEFENRINFYKQEITKI